MQHALLGNLSLSAIHYHNPIIMAGVGIMVVSAVVVLGGITYFGKWLYLWKEWLTSVDHKKIGIMYIILALVMLVRGGIDAIMMRSQQALAEGASRGYLPPHHFDQVFSSHGTIMIFFMAMPFLVGLINVAMPQQIGARDVAFPFMNSISLWLTVAGAMLVMVSLAIGDFSTAGWSDYPPLAELKYSPGSGVDYWIWAVQITGVGSLMTGINFLVTILKMRAPGLRLMRMTIFTWAALTTSVLMVLAFPVLTVTVALLTLDRYLATHFFTAGLGGNVMMYTNMFWAWGHPEVYILILPAFGVFSEVTATFSGKRLFGYSIMVYATVVIMLLSFTVWLHHFFTMGASADVNDFFSTMTMLIAIPTGVKIFNWLFTMYRGRVRFTTPMLWTLGFIVTFTLGGASGVLLSVPPADWVLHNSELLVAHFHNVLVPGSLFGYFAGYYYWFPKAFGFRLNERWGRRAFWAWIIGFYVAFMPLYVLGMMGMPRRLDHYANPAWQPYLIAAAAGTALMAFGALCQAIQLAVSIRDRAKTRDLVRDPWDGRALEWATASPPAFYNFAVIPVVHDLDAFTDMKERGVAYARPERYHDIHMPKDTGLGFVIGLAAAVFGFAMVWHIWWLAPLGALVVAGSVIARASADETEYVVPAAEVARIEDRRYVDLAAAGIDIGDRHEPGPRRPALQPVP